MLLWFEDMLPRWINILRDMIGHIYDDDIFLPMQTFPQDIRSLIVQEAGKIGFWHKSGNHNRRKLIGKFEVIHILNILHDRGEDVAEIIIQQYQHNSFSEIRETFP